MCPRSESEIYINTTLQFKDLLVVLPHAILAVEIEGVGGS